MSSRLQRTQALDIEVALVYCRSSCNGDNRASQAIHPWQLHLSTEVQLHLCLSELSQREQQSPSELAFGVFMWTLKPHQPAHQVTHSMTASDATPAPHWHPSAAQQNPQELHTPPTAQPLQQPPRVHNRQPPRSCPTASDTHFQPTGKDSYMPSGCSRLENGKQAQQQTPHAKSESHLLQLLTNANPVRSADELLARLRSPATTEAALTPSHHVEPQGHRGTSNRLTCNAVSNMEHDGAVVASTGPRQTMLHHVMIDSPALLGQRSWAPATQQTKLGRHEKKTSSHTLGHAAVHDSIDGSDGHTALTSTAGKYCMYAIGMPSPTAHSLSGYRLDHHNA